MTANRDLKRLVRARTKKTGESYTAALQHLRRGAAEKRSAPHQPPTLRRVEKAEFGYAVHIPDDWTEVRPDLFNSEWEVGHFMSPGPRYRSCRVFRTPQEQQSDLTMVARSDAVELARSGYGNFRHAAIRLAGRRAAWLAFDRATPDGRVWSCRYHYVAAAGMRFCLALGTWAIDEDGPLQATLAARFELIGALVGQPGPEDRPGSEGTSGTQLRRSIIRVETGARVRVKSYTAAARRAMSAALEEAVRQGASIVGPEHVLAGIAAGSAGGAPSVLAALGSEGDVRRAMETMLPPQATAEHEETEADEGWRVVTVALSDETERALALAEEEARSRGATVRLEHLLIGVLDGGVPLMDDLLEALGVVSQEAISALRRQSRAVAS